MNLINIPYRLPTFAFKWLLSRGIKKSAITKTNQKLILEQLDEREVIQVKGDEVVPFLQGLITNDVKHLCPSPNKAMYAMFLNKTGRVMYDVILYSTSEPTTILIECDKNVANELQRHLKLYRVRRKIDIVSLSQELNVWQAFKPNKEAQNVIDVINKELTDLTISTDPRLKQLGIRMLAKSDQTFSDLSILFKLETAVSNTGDNRFRLHRYNLGIAEGVIDIPPGKCFPLEANCDILNGVSFHKGCYVGQELTARVHHTGVVRKRHMPVSLMAPLSADTTTIVQNEAGANCGVIYGSLVDKALGLLRVEKVLKAKELFVNGNLCVTERPQWWPHELYSNVLKEVVKGISNQIETKA